MKIHIVAVGSKMPAWVDEGFKSYTKRMPPDFCITLQEVKAEPRSLGKTAEQMMQLEAHRIRAILPQDAKIVALDENGSDWTSLTFAEKIQTWKQENCVVAFLIGGPDGLAADLKMDAAMRLRLSSFTLPHGMARVVLAEQLYRAWSILIQHPYHRK